MAIVEEMRKKRVGNSDMELTPIGVGAWAMGGGGWAFAWGAQDDDESIAAIHEALDRGVNWIDTAAVYGLGHAEELVGRLIRQLPPGPRFPSTSWFPSRFCSWASSRPSGACWY